MNNDWNNLYQKLCHLLLKYGKNDPYGNGDYWVVDDDWGEMQQKICIFKPEVLQHKLLADIQLLLSGTCSKWTVIIAIEIDGLASDGLLLTDLKVQQIWNLAELRKVFGPDFFTT